MINIFINYLCNLNCDYCFATQLTKQYPTNMDLNDFKKVCSWLVENDVYSVGILGGEPTLHEKLPEMLTLLNDNGIATVLFTNGLFDNLDYDFLVSYVYNFVINFNNPEFYSDKQWHLLNHNIEELVQRDASIAFSKNFSEGRLEYEYLIDAAKKYNIKKIRYDISRPNNLSDNTYYDMNNSKKVIGHIIDFVKTCERNGIATGLDCCEPLCYFGNDELKYMSDNSMKFSGICRPSIDIQTDLSVVYCMPMQNIRMRNVLDYSGELDLLSHFSKLTKELRNIPKDDNCKKCSKFGKICQGGCLALKAIDYK